MLKEAIGVGETVVEAQEDACKQLGVEPHEAEIEVLQMPEKKKFGIFGGNPAKVRAYMEVSPAQSAAGYLDSILKAMGLHDITMEINETEEGAVINLSGEEVGFVIGRRGETLDALQYLCGLVANHVDNTYFRVTIDTGNYREKREKTLEILGRKLAFKALKTGKNVPLEPMNPYERRIIHTAVQKVNGAISWSEGESINRHVVIGLDPKAPRPPRGGGYNGGYNKNRGPKRPYNGGGYKKDYNNNRDFNRDRGSRPPRPQQGTQPAVKREPRNEGGDFSLYGKIEPRKEKQTEE